MAGAGGAGGGGQLAGPLGAGAQQITTRRRVGSASASKIRPTSGPLSPMSVAITPEYFQGQ